MSESYGECELDIGTGGNTYINNLWQQAAAQGITVLVSTGDSGAANCDDAGANYAVYGNAVNGLASTPWNIAVGGTDFNLPNGGAAYFSKHQLLQLRIGTELYSGDPMERLLREPERCRSLRLLRGDSPLTICNLSAASSDGLLRSWAAAAAPAPAQYPTAAPSRAARAAMRSPPGRAAQAYP